MAGWFLDLRAVFQRQPYVISISVVSLRIATYNIRKGGSPGRAAIAEVLKALDPDITVLQEATDPTVVEWLAQSTGAAVSISQRGRSVAVIARAPAPAARWHRLPTGNTFAEVDLPGGIRLLGVHLSSGLSARGERRRAIEVDRVLTVAAGPPGPGRTLIIGDLNAMSPSDALSVATLPAWIRLLLGSMAGSAPVSSAGPGRRLRRRLPAAEPAGSGATLPAVARPCASTT